MYNFLGWEKLFQFYGNKATIGDSIDQRLFHSLRFSASKGCAVGNPLFFLGGVGAWQTIRFFVGIHFPDGIIRLFKFLGLGQVVHAL